MGLFTTKTRHTYHHSQPKRGWSTTSKASTRLKRWARRKTKGLWRTTKRRVRNRWRTYQRKHPTRKQQIARTARQFQRHHAKIHARTVHPSYQSDSGTLEGQVKLPPPDGATSTCRRCSNEVQYSEGHGRWEHTGHGHWECFQPHRS